MNLYYRAPFYVLYMIRGVIFCLAVVKGGGYYKWAERWLKDLPPSEDLSSIPRCKSISTENPSALAER